MPTGPVGSRDSVTGRRIKPVGGKKGGRSSQAQAQAPAPSSKPKRKQIEAATTTASTESSKKRRRESNASNDDTQQSIDADILEASEDEEELEVEQDSEDENEEEDDDEDDDQPLIHETLLLQNGNASTSSAGLQPRAKKAAKYAGESQADRDARTTFVGNVPVVCATNKVGPNPLKFLNKLVYIADPLCCFCRLLACFTTELQESTG